MIQSIARAVQILNLFRDTPRLGISQIAQKVGLPKTTVFGLVQSLCEENFLARDPQTHDYSLGIALFELGTICESRLDLRKISAPFMQSLYEKVNDTVQLTVLTGRYSTYISKVVSPNNMTFAMAIGVRAFAHCTASGKVLLALSGGVDSAVAAALLYRAVGEQLTCIFVDHGLLRKDEGDQVERAMHDCLGMRIVRVNAQERFLTKLAGISEPERKRKIIGEEFIRVFEAEAKKLGRVDFLAQGTIYPDVVESGVGGESVVIKSHHNVGGLPDHVDFKEIIEPLRRLFKDEVRQLGIELGLPESLVWRQPFPGPGLAIRVIGDITEEKLHIVREADAIFREEVAKAGLERSINQYFAALTNLRSVGVMGDERTYDYAIALRAVETQDFMTADFSRLPWELLDTVSRRIVNEVKGVNRILYDVTSKPPATVELE